MTLRSTAALAALAAALSLAACGGGGGGIGGTGASTGTMHFAMTDAPACGYDEVNITIALAQALADPGLVEDEGDPVACAREGCDSVRAPRACLRPRTSVDVRLARHWGNERRTGVLDDAGRLPAD